MILHKITDSPDQSSALKTCLRYATQDDCILLSANAVNCLLKPSWRAQLAEFNTLALQEDLIARGLATVVKGVDQVNYSEFVALTLKYDKIISW
ncbi:sulfurtransferase complex subunit TusB [Shewanella sp. 125m-7]